MRVCTYSTKLGECGIWGKHYEGEGMRGETFVFTSLGRMNMSAAWSPLLSELRKGELPSLVTMKRGTFVN